MGVGLWLEAAQTVLRRTISQHMKDRCIGGYLLVMFTFSFSTALRLWSLEVTWAWRM
jgi:hypothetical protein